MTITLQDNNDIALLSNNNMATINKRDHVIKKYGDIIRTADGHVSIEQNETQTEYYFKVLAINVANGFVEMAELRQYIDKIPTNVITSICIISKYLIERTEHARNHTLLRINQLVCLSYARRY
jgi:hypothetical protein